MVIIINGKGGCGKDTLIESLGSCIMSHLPDSTPCEHKIYNHSAIDRIKEIARYGGWNDDKSDKGRMLLYSLKMAFVNYNDLPARDLLDKVTQLHRTDAVPVIFLHIREPEEIRKMVDILKNHDIPVETCLIKRETTDKHDYGNHADDDVEKFNYNYTFDNNPKISVAKRNFKNLIEGIVESNYNKIQKR